MLSKQVIAILTESDKLSGQARRDFVRDKFEALEQAVKQAYPQS